jgi:hypothetical protein
MLIRCVEVATSMSMYGCSLLAGTMILHKVCCEGLFDDVPSRGTSLKRAIRCLDVGALICLNIWFAVKYAISVCQEWDGLPRPENESAGATQHAL